MMYLKEVGIQIFVVQYYYRYYGCVYRNRCQQGGTKYGGGGDRNWELFYLGVEILEFDSLSFYNLLFCDFK